MSYFMLGMMIPVHCVLIPLFVQFSKIGLTDSLIGLIIRVYRVRAADGNFPDDGGSSEVYKTRSLKRHVLMDAVYIPAFLKLPRLLQKQDFLWQV